MTIRIGFIAMSGVRADSPELMEAGLTFPGVLERGEVIASLPSLSLLTLAALTPPLTGVPMVTTARTREGRSRASSRASKPPRLHPSKVTGPASGDAISFTRSSSGGR